VAGHQLIDAYLLALARRLPGDAVDELADGLTETYLRHLSSGLDADTAAGAAINEFGQPGQVVAAFVRYSPGRRVARVLLCTGPAVGICWGAALVVSHAWTWPVPIPVRLAFGLTLLAIVASLVAAATGLDSYRRTRLAAAAGLGLIALDTGVLSSVVLVAPPFVWPLALAIPASLIRITLTARAMPRLLAHP
jgi:hypothetical protein